VSVLRKGSAITSRTRQQIWDLDLIGNWSVDQVDLNGDNDFVDAGEHNVSNTFNNANEQDPLIVATQYDEVGNLIDNEVDQKYVYDAWGRMVEVRNQSSVLISRHRYNGLGYRIAWQYDLDADGGVEPTNSNDDPWLYQVHDSSWRVVATVFAVDNGAGTEAGEPLAKADDEPAHPPPGSLRSPPSPRCAWRGSGSGEEPLTRREDASASPPRQHFAPLR
jgi:YD repeat-containing protein